MIKQVGHQVTRAKQAGTDAGLGNREHPGNLYAGKFFEGRKHQHLAFLRGQLIDTSENVSVVLGCGRALLGS